MPHHRRIRREKNLLHYECKERKKEKNLPLLFLFILYKTFGCPGFLCWLIDFIWPFVAVAVDEYDFYYIAMTRISLHHLILNMSSMSNMSNTKKEEDDEISKTTHWSNIFECKKYKDKLSTRDMLTITGFFFLNKKEKKKIIWKDQHRKLKSHLCE